MLSIRARRTFKLKEFENLEIVMEHEEVDIDPFSVNVTEHTSLLEIEKMYYMYLSIRQEYFDLLKEGVSPEDIIEQINNKILELRGK